VGWLRKLAKRTLLSAPLSLGLPFALSAAANRVMTEHGCFVGEICAHPLALRDFLPILGVFVTGLPLIVSFFVFVLLIDVAFKFLGIAFSVPLPGIEPIDGAIAIAIVAALVVQAIAGGLLIQVLGSFFRWTIELGKRSADVGDQNGPS
jgi:hypothetical protein